MRLSAEPNSAMVGSASSTTGYGTATSSGAPVEITAKSVAGLRSMRQALERVLTASRWLRSEIADAQLVLAELATNAFTHDCAPEFSAVVTCSNRQLEITTFHAGRVLPPEPPVAPASDDTPGGRGLIIVDQIVNERLVSSRAGVTSTYVRLTR
ncbi:MAG: ATP-binding protein [Ilumatobacter sp.]|nr:ATP-binding protein [Ilumatobacter sp.]